MPRPQQPLLRSSEADIQLAISFINKNQIQTERAAVQIYTVSVRVVHAPRDARRTPFWPT
jgi:hypothetical protein